MFTHTERATVTELRARASKLGEMVSSRKIAHNTIEAHYADGSRVIMLHRTPILTWRKDGTIIVYTGGYNTVTTRERLNRFLPDGFDVYTQSGNIHLNGVPFKERATIAPDGTIELDVKPAELMTDRKLIDRFMLHVRKNGLPSIEESSGDPWCFFSPDVGETVMHDWLESLYFTRRMYTLAMEFAGMTPYGISFFMHDADKNGKLSKFELGRIRRYIRSQLGLAH